MDGWVTIFTGLCALHRLDTGAWVTRVLQVGQRTARNKHQSTGIKRENRAGCNRNLATEAPLNSTIVRDMVWYGLPAIGPGPWDRGTVGRWNRDRGTERPTSQRQPVVRPSCRVHGTSSSAKAYVRTELWHRARHTVSGYVWRVCNRRQHSI